MNAADIYAKCLLPLKEGYPLYCPELPDRRNVGAYYEAYRSQGIGIGDVGIITPDGDFDFLFNICNGPRSDNDVDSSNATVSQTNIGSIGTVAEIRPTGPDRDSNPLNFISATSGPVTSPAVPTGSVLIDPGEIRVRRNYINPTDPFRSCGRDEQTRFNLEASMNAIV
jgi:hypothetical protein